ncbi:unnamed protein product [Periconia digitata]|uniref:ASTRA-associated protein 1 n=1 Tax=Periconia digitata TaxID=1303443 RepID=A0A9W4U4R4_9PLEO|nr:unnamed protein product [Periconia digitata]
MALDTEQQSSARGPAQPSFVFRGHTAQIHSAHIVCRNTCLVTGDADGWVVLWKLETKRALAVWKAHDGAILETSMWGSDRFITHGRDHSLRIWQLDPSNTATFSKALPAEGADIDRPKPWLLHSLPVNTLNFCAFSVYHDRHVSQDSHPEQSHASASSVLVAVPARDDKKVEVYQFPQEKLVCVVPKVESRDTGMVMAVKLVHHSLSNNILIAVGYEGGFISVYTTPHPPPQDPQAPRNPIQIAQLVYLSQPHSQPILSLDALPQDETTFFTSSADAIIATHTIKDLPINDAPAIQWMDQGGAGAEDVFKKTANPNQKNDITSSTHDDIEPRVSAVSDSDSNTTSRVVQDQASSLVQPASTSLLDFTKKTVPPSANNTTATATSTKQGGLSSLFSNAAEPQPRSKPPQPSPPKPVIPQPPHKFTNTKHAGQQSLRVRSDGRLLVTGGWDKRVRIYSTKTLKEVAVLKWHAEGVYAVDFGEIMNMEDVAAGNAKDEQEHAEGGDEVAKRETGLGRLQRQREERMQVKHWVVSGAKDGKVSLWEVF